MPENPTFTIPKDVIDPIIKAHVATAITSALGGRDELITKAISRVLFQKVDHRGEPSDYSSNPEFIQWACRNAITEAVKSCLTEEIKKHEEKLKALISAALSKKNSPLVKQLAEGLVGAISNPDVLKWRLNVTCEQNKDH